MRVLLATDGSHDSDYAARTLPALGLPAGATVTVMSVMEPPHYWVTPAVPPSYLGEMHKVQHEVHLEAEEAARDAVEKAARILAEAGMAATAMTREGHPVVEIANVAEQINADLVVVGSRGLTGSRVFLLGSVSQGVISYSPCSVLVAKPTAHADEPRVDRILLATDGSENAEHAARFLGRFQSAESAEIVIVHVLHHHRRWMPSSGSSRQATEQFMRASRENAERLVEETKQHLPAAARVTTCVSEGEPAEQILKTASETGADLIVMGSKGLSGIKLFLLGSVSRRVSRHSDRSVMLVKLGRASAGADQTAASDV